jgi:hypothetical protein
VIGRTREPRGFRVEKGGGREDDGVWARVGRPSTRALEEAAAVLARNWRRGDLGWADAGCMRMGKKLYLAKPGAVKRVLGNPR